MELFKDLGLKEICGIIGTLGNNTSISNIQNVIEVNGIRYYYEKDGNTLTITSQDNSTCTISINYKAEEKDNKLINLKHEVDIKQTSKEGNTISMHNDLVLNPGYESFENVQRHNLMKGLKLQYNDQAEFNLGLSTIHLNSTNQDYEFTKHGIKYGNYELLIEGDIIRKDIPIIVKDLREMRKALLIRTSIKNDVNNSSITPEVLDHIDRDLRSITKQQKSNIQK